MRDQSRMMGKAVNGKPIKADKANPQECLTASERLLNQVFKKPACLIVPIAHIPGTR